MASNFELRPSSRRQSTNSNSTIRRADELASSLQKLSIAQGSPSARHHQSHPIRSPHLVTPGTPSRQSSPSPRRAPSRSPSTGPNGRSGSATPSLHRKASLNSLHSANGVGGNHTPLRRASSSNHLMSPSSPTAYIAPIMEEKPPVTAASIARDCFSAEFDECHNPERSKVQTQAVVILNDAVYGHRFSRPRTSKNALGTIVERPERIKAGILGISMAYVRLGQRHCEGSLSPHPRRDPRTITSIPFRIQKTTNRVSVTSPAVTNVHGVKWMEDFKSMCESAESKLAMSGKELQRPPRSRGGDEPAPEKLHEGDLYLCSESLDAVEGALGAVCEAVDTVFGSGPRRAFVGVRPPGHHCSASHPSGFCWVNNVHVGIMHAALNHQLTHAVIIDFDLHHGDGSQSITWAHNQRCQAAVKNTAAWKKTSIAYFSLHDINSYPCEGGDEDKVKNASLCIDNAHGQTVWNVHLQSWKTERDFWDLYETKYAVILEKTRSYLKAQAQRLRAINQEPKTVIFFSAGFDASEWESPGMQRHQVNVPTEFYARLSQDVVKLAAEEGLGVDGRVVSVLEGGYSDRALCSGVFSHLSGLVGDQTPGSAFQQWRQDLENATFEGPLTEPYESRSSTNVYDPSWWSSSELERLESLVIGPVEPPKRARQSPTTTFASPTQASTAKVSDPIKMRRSLSGLASMNKSLSRPASPPPPEVPWEVAAHELSKLIIPADRQTDSCRAEELNAEATKARQARQSEIFGATPGTTPERASSRMSLRGRKTRPVAPIEEVSSKNRRKTTGTTTASRESALPTRGATSTEPTNNLRRTSRRISGVPPISPTSPEDTPPLPRSDKIVRHTGALASSSRPDLSQSRTHSTGSIPAKATKATTIPKREPVKSASAVPAPSRGVKKTIPAAAPAAKATSSSSQQKPSTTASKPAEKSPDASGMDKLTAGMKKIRINLITQSQREAKERGRLQGTSSIPSPRQQSRSSSKASSPLVSPTTTTVPEMIPKQQPRASSVTRPSMSTTTKDSTPESRSKYIPASGLAPRPQTRGSDTISDVLSSPVMPVSSPPVPQVAVQPPTDVFIPYQPDGPTAIIAGHAESLQWLPPNIDTPTEAPSIVKRENRLFQHTGNIQFAPRSSSSSYKPNAGRRSTSGTQRLG